MDATSLHVGPDSVPMTLLPAGAIATNNFSVTTSSSLYACLPACLISECSVKKKIVISECLL
jgi:hypothetical protein